MDSVLGYVLQAITQHGLPVLVALGVGAVLGYLFFRSRSKDEREAISTITKADSELKKRLEAAEDHNVQADATIASLREENARLQEAKIKAESTASDLTLQIKHWKSRAEGAVSSSDGPLDDALDVFL